MTEAQHLIKRAIEHRIPVKEIAFRIKARPYEVIRMREGTLPGDEHIPALHRMLIDLGIESTPIQKQEQQTQPHEPQKPDIQPSRDHFWFRKIGG